MAICGAAVACADGSWAATFRKAGVPVNPDVFAALRPVNSASVTVRSGSWIRIVGSSWLDANPAIEAVSVPTPDPFTTSLGFLIQKGT